MQTEIVDISEVIVELGLGSSISDADRALLFSQKLRVENDVRRYLGHGITQPSRDYVHYLPNRPIETEDYEDVRIQGTKVTFRQPAIYGDVLQLPQMYVRSITEIREDLDAVGGVGASIFTSDTLLIQDTDYRLDADEPGMSRAGQVIRMGTTWSSLPRTIRVVYMAGFTAAELDDEYSDVKGAVIDETISRFKFSKSRAGADSSGAGPVKSESLGGQYSVSYDTSAKSVSSGGLSQMAMERLERFLNIAP